MARSRAITAARLLGNFFVLFVLSVLIFIYYNFMLYFLSIRLTRGVLWFLALFHLSLLMFFISFVKAMLTDPGEVPPLWGFYMGDSDSKRKRYCLMCHVFKPERCHHCSACNRCVLNMDHHCPWINNCVGFYNKKFFILLLVYVLLSSYLVAVGMGEHIYYLITELLRTRDTANYPVLLMIGAYLLNCLLAVVLTIFLKFHIKLICSNSTTIENMEKGTGRKISFSKGPELNWKQVFGDNPWL